MSKVRVLVGTRKGAFILESDAKRDNWNITGPHFGGWEIYHVNGSPADPNRIYASQSSGWVGQMIQRSDDGGQTWERYAGNPVLDIGSGVGHFALVCRRLGLDVVLRDTSEVGRARLHYFLLNKGPWSRLDENEPFVEGAGPFRMPVQYVIRDGG